MSQNIKDSYLDTLKAILSKRQSYEFPKGCSELLSNPDSTDGILLNRVYEEFSKELMGALEIVGLSIGDLPSPPQIRAKMVAIDKEVIVELPIVSKEVLAELIRTPGANYNKATNILSYPLHSSIIPYLRTIVKEFKPEMSESTIELLKSTTSAEAKDNSLAYLAIKDNKILLKLRYPYLKISEQIAKLSSTPAELSNTEYYFPLGLKENIVSILELSNVNTIYSDNFEADTTRFEPIAFSGNINHLSKISVTELKGIKDKRANKFFQYGIDNLFDLLFTFPRKYIDKSNPVLIKDIKEGDDVAFIANVNAITMDYPRKMLKITLSDSTGKIGATFFNSAWMAKKFVVGQQVLVYGKADGWGSTYARKVSLTNPTIEKFENVSATIIPIYPQSQKAGVSSGDLYNAITQGLERIPNLFDPIDEHLESGDKVYTALKKIHKPTNMLELEESTNYFIKSELVKLQLFMLLQKHWMSSQKGSTHKLAKLKNILDTLPYKLTNAQHKAIEDIRNDLENSKPMNRLLQGDVGSGKTLVAATAMMSLLSGSDKVQGAIMAPTEILATQLYNEFVAMFDSFSEKTGSDKIKISLFTNKLKAKEKAQLYEELASGEIQLAIGTHALIAEKIEFNNLAFVIIDEQHRFGVSQRAALSEKNKSGDNPDLLIMTATPIPRTAALTVFGSVDISTLDELPPGRIPIKTTWIKSDSNLDSESISPWSDVRNEISKGRQAYVVCPLVEDNPKLELSSAEETVYSLSQGALKGLKLALVHGQQKPAEREVIMNAYKNGEYDVLVSTTVIEVGVNVPNATIMVILDAERFGISQLHQLRGRVGRASYESYCYLVSKTSGEQSAQRLQALVDSTDGFYLSEVDLQIRGHGQLFGEAQSGISDLRVADLDRDSELVTYAREVAVKLQQSQPVETLLSLITSEQKLDNIFRA